MRTLIVIGFALILAGSAQAQDTSALLLQGTSAYQAGDYAKAAEAYRALTQAGVESVDVYFNLGTSELRAGRRGAAIHAFERALRIDADDPDVLFNLAEAQRGNIDKVVGAREEEPLAERIGARVPGETVGWLFLASWILAIGAFVARRFFERVRGLFTSVGIFALIAAVASGALVGAAAWYEVHARYAVVVAPVTAVREGPAEDFKSAFEVHEGLKVRVIRLEKGFLRIRLPNGVEGWAAQKDVPLI